MRRICATLLLTLTVLATGRVRAADSDSIEFQSGIEYSNPHDEHLKLDLGRPKSSEGLAPAVVCIHGGGWAGGGREGWDDVCKQLAGRGYVAITITYRLAPKYIFPAQACDVKAAVRWLRANAERLKVDPNRIGAVGDSAGGHLSMFLGATGGVPEFDREGENQKQSSRVQCVVDYYGPSDLTRGYGRLPMVDQLISQFLGGNLEHAHEAHIRASPLFWVTPEAAPMLLIHGTKDALVSPDHATWMHDRLKSVDVDTELLILEGAGHGFGGDDLKRARDATFAFFDKHLKKK